MTRPVVEMSFDEVAALNVGDWIEAIKEWLKKVEEALEGYEASSATLNIAAPPSASITFTKNE
jgi:hypothetical protein